MAAGHRQNPNPKAINTKGRIQMPMKRLIAFALLLLSAGTSFAHGGAEHLMGTVVKVSADTIEVKTTKGETKQIMFDSKTSFTKAGAKIQAAELKKGDRVVMEVHEMKAMKGMLQAESVKVGTDKVKTTGKEKSHAH